MKVNKLRIGNLVFVTPFLELKGVPMRFMDMPYNANCEEYYARV